MLEAAVVDSGVSRLLSVAGSEREKTSVKLLQRLNSTVAYPNPLKNLAKSGNTITGILDLL